MKLVKAFDKNSKSFGKIGAVKIKIIDGRNVVFAEIFQVAQYVFDDIVCRKIVGSEQHRQASNITIVKLINDSKSEIKMPTIK